MPDDYTQDTSTTASVTVGGTATGEIETAKDFDWFAVNLVAGQTYVIDLEGLDSGGGTLINPILRSLYDADGNRIDGTRTASGGTGRDARLTFTATVTGTYYIEARGYRNQTGDFTVRVTQSVDADAERGGATDLGDITELDGPRFPNASLDGNADRLDYFKFELTEARKVGLGLRQQDANADLFLEDAEGAVLYSSTEAGTANEKIWRTLLAGTYYVRVEAQEEGDNQFKLRYGVSEANAAVAAQLEAQQQQATNQAPAFAEASYAFDLAENSDGSTTPVALGTVSATDPEGSTETYSIVAGNSDGLFEINSASGALSYKGTGENYESGTTSYTLTVRASDGSLYNDVTVTVNITDAAEAPAFAEASYAFDLAENSDGSTTPVALGTVSATDPEGSTETYSIVAGNSDGLFEINSASGALSYKGTGENYESGTTSYTLTVRASDGSLYNDVTVTVNITDAAEAPVFAEASYAFDLAENTDGSTTPVELGTVSATDPEGSTETYSIVAGNSDGLFEINSASGALSYKGTGENYEKIGGVIRHALTVRASDGDLHSDVTVLVNLTDIAEAPVFAEASYAFDLEENTDGSTTAVALGTVSATDPELSTVIYSIEGGNSDGLFAIDSATGALTYHGTGEDYESGTTSYALTVRASDGSLQSDVTVTVNVTDVQDLTDSQPQSTVSEADGEDLPAGTSTAGRVLVGDTATGNIGTSGDRDWFAVDLVAGRTYAIDLRGSPTGDGTLNDPYLHGISLGTWYGSWGYAYLGNTSDDDGGEGDNSRLLFTPRTDGTHYVVAAASRGSQGTYELEVTELDDDFGHSSGTTGTVEVGGSATGEIQYADDHDWFAVALKAGKTYQIDVGGAYTDGGTHPRPHLDAVYNSGGNNMGVYDPVIILPTWVNGVQEFAGEDEQAFFTPDTDGTYYIAVSNYYPSDAGTYTVKVAEIDDDLPATVDTTGTVEVGGTATGELQYETDRDWFAVVLTGGETYKIELLGARGKGGTLQDPYIRGIHDSDGNLIADTTDYSSGPYSNSEVLFTPDDNGTYYVAAGSFVSGLRDEDVGTYMLQVSIDDFGADTETTGTVAVGGSVTGEVEAQGDRDWFAVTLEADKTYQIDMEGSPTNTGTLANPFFRGVHDSDGDQIAFTWDQDSGEGLNSRATFTPDEDGTYYLVAASGGPFGSADSHGRSLGTYTLSVDEVVDPVVDVI